MTLTDMTTQTALRLLLQDQARQLVTLRADAGVLLERARHTISAEEWHGPAREMYERLAHQLTVEVANLAAALDDAATASERGLRTLGTGVP